MVKIITLALVTMLASGALAAETTKCTNKSSAGLFANTNPKPSSQASIGTSATQGATR